MVREEIKMEERRLKQRCGDRKREVMRNRGPESGEKACSPR